MRGDGEGEREAPREETPIKRGWKRPDSEATTIVAVAASGRVYISKHVYDYFAIDILHICLGQRNHATKKEKGGTEDRKREHTRSDR